MNCLNSFLIKSKTNTGIDLTLEKKQDLISKNNEI